MQHGTRYAWFTGGCRCEECAEGRRANDRARRQRRKERAKADPSIIPHGKNGYADYGCRCDICHQYHLEANRRRQGNSPAKTWAPEVIDAAMVAYTEKGLKAAAKVADASESLVRKWAKQRGLSVYRPPLVHGTRSAYDRRGCRCEQCKAGVRTIRKAEAAKLRAKSHLAPHGSPSAYFNWGCRCDLCKKAGSIENARVAARRKRRQAS